MNVEFAGCGGGVYALSRSRGVLAELVFAGTSHW